MNEHIATKCVYIIRHRKGFKSPKIYEVDIDIRGDNLFNFNKGKEIKENVSKVIEERNNIIAENKESSSIYENYFFIIEYDIPFFRGDFEKYADLFEFMDVPGLNEDIKDNNKKKSFYFKQIFPIINMNIQFSL